MTTVIATSLGYTFRHPELADAALRHPSLPGKKVVEGEHFERLEFLGDRVVGLCIAAMLMEKFPKEAEGPLTRRHTSLVRAGTLAAITRETGLVAQLQVATSDTGNENVLADALEAMFGAIYLDGGMSAVEPLVRQLWASRFESAPLDQRDAKTRLQEWAQAKSPQLPQYEVLNQHGPSHAPVFKVRVSVQGGAQAIGEGTSKRAAEQAAAQELLNTVEEKKQNG